MEKVTSVVVFVLAFVTFIPGAHAAMPNFIGTGYKQAVDCTLSTDRHIWELVDSKFVKVGCITQEAHEAAETLARETQEGFRFGIGQSVVLKSGHVETCPTWFLFSGCVIARSMIR